MIGVGARRSGMGDSSAAQNPIRAEPSPIPERLPARLIRARAAGLVQQIVWAVVVMLVLTTSVEAKPWAWMGVRIRDLSEQEMEEIAARHGIREGFGVVIVEVLEGTPAAKAGIKNGDIVVALEERPIVDTRMLQRLIAAASIEKDTRVTVLRREGRRAIAMRLVTMPRDVTGERIGAEFGFVLREPEGTGELAGRRPPSSTPSVTVVLRGSPAEKAGLQVGDVIQEINDQAVVTREAAREALADVATDRPLRLRVRRGEDRLSLTLVSP